MRFLSVFTLIMVVALLLFSNTISGTERMVIRFLNPDHNLVEEFLKEDYDIASYRPNEYLDIVVTEQQLELFRARGYDPIITQTEERLKNNLQKRSERIEGYRTYDDVLDEILTLAQMHSDIVRIYDLGDSWAKIYTQEGNNYYQNYQHDIWGVKVTTNPDSLNDKPAVYYMGAHHAREPLSAEVPMDFLNLLLDNYQTDDEIAYLIDNTEIWFIPLVNPDGHKIVLNQVDVWWRKNIRDNNNNGSFDTFNYYGYGTDGVDLNRNYAFEWAPGGQFSAPTYPGPSPASEPEVQPMQQLMAEHHFVAGITYHTYSELVLYPFGYASNIYAPDVAALSDLAVTMAETIPKLNSPGHYDPMPSWDLYPARGTTDDYAYGVHGIFSYTFELGVEFIPSPPHIQQISDDNMEAALILLRRVHNSTLTGHVTDSTTGEPLIAEVFIEGIDDTGVFRYPYLSNEHFGRYYRLLLPGEHDVTFSAYGYVDSGPHTVTITDEGQTLLSVALDPAGEGMISGTVTDFFTQTPIANALVEIIDAPLDPAYTDDEGSYLFDTVPYGVYQIKITAEGFGMHIEEVIVSQEENFCDIELFSPYYTDAFDNLNYWQLSGDWGLSEQYVYSGNYSLADSPAGNYQSNMNSYALFDQDIDLTTAFNASLSFYARYSLETAYDFCYLQVSDNSREWQTIATFNGFSDWSLHQYSLNDFLGSEIAIRFHFTSDASVEEEGIYIDDFNVFVSSTELSVSQDIEIAPADRLHPNYPNPFNTETTISFTIVADGTVKLDIYNILGQKIRTLINDEMPAGVHYVVWDGKNNHNQTVGSGVYFYRLERNDSSQVKKMILLK